jgi:hypothetical protein
MTRTTTTLLTLLAAGLLAAPAHAADHLKCYTVKDPAPKAAYVVNLTPSGGTFPQESGCVVKVPAKLICSPVDKVITAGNPPGAPGGQPFDAPMFCYKLKCPKGKVPDQTGFDQFGNRQMVIKAPGMPCTPGQSPKSGS